MGMLALAFGRHLSEYYAIKPNTFQRWELLKYLDAFGIKILHGWRILPGDSVYNFKMNFAKGCDNPFLLAKIHNPDIYEQVQEQRKTKHHCSRKVVHTFCKVIESWIGENYNKLRYQPKTFLIRYVCDVAPPSKLLGIATASQGQEVDGRIHSR